MADLTESELAEIEARARDLPGVDWTTAYHHVWFVDMGASSVVFDPGQNATQEHVEEMARAAVFTAHSRTDVPRLVAAVRARDEAIGHYREVIRSLESRFAQIAETCAKIGANHGKP